MLGFLSSAFSLLNTLFKGITEFARTRFWVKAGREAATNEMLRGQDAVRVREIQSRETLRERQDDIRRDTAEEGKKLRANPNDLFDRDR